MDDTRIYVKGVRVATEAELDATSAEINETINDLDTEINSRIDTEVDTLNTTINDLNDDLTAAINDVASDLSDATTDLNGKIGTLSNLNTVDKSNLVNAIDEVNSTFANYLSKTNQVSYSPSADFHPSTKKYVDDAIAAIRQLHFEIVQQLPQVGDPTIIYMILQSPGLGQDDYYDEWIYISNRWEKIGSTRINLSNYLAKDNQTLYTPSGDYNPATKKYIDDIADDLDSDIGTLRTDMEEADAGLEEEINDIKAQFFVGVQEEWDEYNEEEKEAFLLAFVEGYVDLNVADTYNLQSILGEEEEIVCDIYEDEAIDLTEQIIGG